MNFDLFLQDFFENVGYNVPAFLAMVAGMVVATTTWQRNPPAARWALLGFAWLFIVALVSIAWRTIGVPLLFPNGPGSPEEILSYVCLSMLEALGYVCFILAFSAARRPYRPNFFHDDFHEEDAPAARR